VQRVPAQRQGGRDHAVLSLLLRPVHSHAPRHAPAQVPLVCRDVWRQRRPTHLPDHVRQWRPCKERATTFFFAFRAMHTRGQREGGRVREREKQRHGQPGTATRSLLVALLRPLLALWRPYVSVCISIVPPRHTRGVPRRAARPVHPRRRAAAPGCRHCHRRRCRPPRPPRPHHPPRHRPHHMRHTNRRTRRPVSLCRHGGTHPPLHAWARTGSSSSSPSGPSYSSALPVYQSTACLISRVLKISPSSKSSSSSCSSSSSTYTHKHTQHATGRRLAR
jgi:hypothetical protein